MFIGTKLVNWIIAFLIFLALVILLMVFFCFVVLGASISLDLFISSSVFSVLLALVTTFFIIRIGGVHISVGALGAWGVLSVAFLIVPLLHIPNTAGGKTSKIAIYVFVGFLGFVLGVYKSEAVKIYFTSLIGSYFFVRGISVYAGGFPDEFALATGDKVSIKPAFYGYCVGILVCLVLSVMF